jgi:hypothetical protein
MEVKVGYKRMKLLVKFKQKFLRNVTGCTLRVSENRVHRRIHGPTREEAAGG